MLSICSVVSDSLWQHGLQHARLLCPSPSPGVYSNSCPLCWWRYPVIFLSSVIPFYSSLLFSPASGSFPMSWLFASGGQIIGIAASASVLPMHIQYWFPLGWTGLIALEFKGLSRVFSNTTIQKHHFWCLALLMVQLSHLYMTTGKTIALAMRTFVGKVMSLLFNMLSRFVITFLLRSKHLLISGLQSPFAVILEPKEITVTISICQGSA